MLNNYFKLAWRVLLRRKFFTFISLFGISFTLMALMLFIATIQTELGSHAPLSQQENMLSIDRIELRKQHYDTIPVIDSSLVDGVMIYDTTSFENKKSGMNRSISGLSRSILEDYYVGIPGLKKMSIFSEGSEYDIFKDNTKINVKADYVDADFWEIFDFSFLEGGPFTKYDFNQEAQKAVISEKLAMNYFGRNTGVVGQEIKVDGKSFEIMGVIEKPIMSFPTVQKDIYIPYSLQSVTEDETFYNGNFNAMMIAANGIEELRKSVIHQTTLVPDDREEGYNEVILLPAGISEIYAQELFHKDDPVESYNTMRVILMALIGLFILLPTLNLINLNVSRILDRSSEIGVRKAFGADQRNIIAQFVFENIVLTFLGGIIGFILAFFLMTIINNAHLLGEARLSIDFKFAIYAILITVLFGIISGFLPAYRMSKTQIVTALKQNQL